VPLGVPGAKLVSFEHIKVHGTSLEGNWEGDAIRWGRVRVVASQLCERESRCYPVVYALVVSNYIQELTRVEWLIISRIM
jgi:hypothetical protein